MPPLAGRTERVCPSLLRDSALPLVNEFLVQLVAEALAHRAVFAHQHRAAYEGRGFADQEPPFRIAARCLACGGQVAPGRRRAVDELVPAADLARPVLQGIRIDRLFAVVDEFMCDRMAIEPVACLAAGVAVGEAVEDEG